MSAGKRTLADWIWTFIGVAGVGCIALAAFLALDGDTKREPEEIVREALETAKAKLDEGDAAGAVEELGAALRLLDGRSAAMQNALGEALLAADRAEEAQTSWRVAIGLHPFFPQPHLNLARWWDGRGEKGPALQHYLAALALFPEPLPAGLADRVAALETELAGRKKEMLAEVEKRLRANPADIESFSVLLLVSLSETKIVSESGPGEGIRAALESLSEKMEGLPELLSRQESAVTDRPGSVVDRAGLGVLLLLSARFEDAGKTFGEALELSAADPTSHLGAALADLLIGEGEPDRILAARDRLVNNPLVWIATGASHLLQDEWEDAVRALFQARGRDPAQPEVYRLLGIAFEKLGNTKDRDAARRVYLRLLK